MTTRKGGAKPRAPRGAALLVRKAVDVRVYAEGLGYVRLTKVAARRLLAAKGDRLVLVNVPELGMLFLEPRSPP